ncbi:hypothetical protein X975_05891, partial [Stegodyphus mimosarum]
MARRLRMNISETACLVGCSRSAAVSIYAKWISDSETGSRHQSIGCQCVIKEKGQWRLSCLVQQNQHQRVAQLTAKYNAGPSCKCSKTHSCASVDQTSLLTMPTASQGTLRLDYR